MSRWTEQVAEEVYQFIRAYKKAHGFPPSIRNIADHCLISRTNVIRYLDKLEKQELIRREPNIPRGITILDEVEDEEDA